MLAELSAPRSTLRGSRLAAGDRIAAVLSGAWRATPPAAELSEAERAVVSPLLLATGGAGLLWRRIHDPEWRASPTGFEVRQACRLSSLHAALHESRIEKAIALCRSAGAEPFLGKGWAIARLYPAPGLRPYGDIDLYVSPDRCDLARAALASPEGGECAVDLHEGFAELDDRRPEELRARSQVVRLGAVDVRCFGPEDHLRLLCLHTLRHGAWRPSGSVTSERPWSPGHPNSTGPTASAETGVGRIGWPARWPSRIESSGRTSPASRAR